MSKTTEEYLKWKRSLEWAKSFIGYNIKEGIYDESVIDGMTDDEIIEFASREEARADAGYEAWKEQHDE